MLARIDRGEQQLNLLRKKVDAYTASVQHGVTHDATHEPNPENPEQEMYKLRILQAPAYLEWALAVGEIVHNARAPLDHLVNLLVLSNGGTPDTTTAFPIFEDPARYAALNPKKKTPRVDSGLRKIEGIDGNAVALITSFQPYGGQQIGRGLLFLHRLWEADKHRLPLLGAGASLLKSVGWYAGEERPAIVFADVRDFKDGTVFAVGIVKPGMPRGVDVHLQLAVKIRFREPGPWGVEEIVPVLVQGIESAREVIGNLAPFVTRPAYE